MAAQPHYNPLPESGGEPLTGGPTVVRILLGTRLRRLRETSGLTREVAGHAIRASHAKISRLELGRTGFKQRDVADLLSLYGMQDEAERANLLELARRANTPGWWHHYADLVPSWFELYVGLEEAASLIRNYEVQFVPGLLQTEAYTRAVTELGHPAADADEIERRVALRMGRQEHVMQAGQVTLWTVVDESALRRPLGGTKAMRAQLEHLLATTDREDVTLQVVPFRSGGHAAAGGPFSILRFNQSDVPDVVYLEQLTSALYLDKSEDVEQYSEIMNRLSVEALQPGETTSFLHELIQEM